MDDRDNDLKILLSALKDGGMYVGEEEEEDEEEEEEEEFEDEDIKDDNVKTDLACPFCSEDFDMLGLCCHIDSEHRIEAKTGICPLCSTKVRTNMATHVIVQHESVLKALTKKKLQNGRSLSALSLLRKELLNLYLEKKSSQVSSSSNTENNQLLLSFVGNQHPTKRSHTRQPCTSAEESLSRNSLDDHTSESSQVFPLMDKDQEEKVQRSEFVKGLLFSTILEDCL
ncbi:protein DEHYDRATION-INDUCED 19 isoform X2 [Capsicum annuum]|uniref:protein DEHYDRATION-INDUCED 19 isoform X2 n=1 Tax=Capsicum annuum TaxID=4072 RepID=UPI0007BF00A5|nr:protein DEHYDRATION-INDUCED 19 isoform X2 [Capsicum annuum]